MVFFFRPAKQDSSNRPLRSRILELDLIGNIILLGAAVMLFLALQLTEEQVPWSSAEVIGLLVGAGLTALLFIMWLWYKGNRALVPLHIVTQRSVSASCLMSFFIYATILIHSYYLPIWFQAVQGDSAVQSGVDMIPYMVASALFSLLAGVVVSVTGYFTPPAIIGCALGTAGCGLLTLLHVHTNSAHWIGYEILISAGFGMALQQGFNAIQTVLPTEEIPIGTAAVVACQSLGGAVFVSVGNSILQGSFLGAAHDGKVAGVNVQAVINAGSSSAAIRRIVPAKALPVVLAVYNGALRKVFIASLALAGCAFLSTLLLEWRSIKKSGESKNTEDGAAPPLSPAMSEAK